MTRRRSAIRVALLLVAASALLGPGRADAQDADAPATLAGYQGSAAASGVRSFYNPSGLLPIAAPVDLGAPDALATINTGPATFARASTADPGEYLANPSALLGLIDPSLSGTVPPYPYRVSATSGVGEPSSELSPGPGLNARVRADDTGSSAMATMPAVEAPAVLTAGSLSASASTTFDGSSIKLHSRAAITGIDVLGLLKIDSIVTDLTATSGAGAPKLEGGTKVTGATILGQPITIDANGIQSGGPSGPNPLVAAVDEALSQVGVRIYMAAPLDLAGGTSGQLTSAGLRIDIEISNRTFPALGQVLDLVPPMDALVPGLPSADDALAAARARHLSTIAVAGASVALKTSSFDATPEEPPFVGTEETPSFAAPSDAAFTLDPITTPTSSPGRVRPTSARGSVGFGEGVGVLALIALLLQPLLGSRLARWSTTMLAADDANTCPREARP